VRDLATLFQGLASLVDAGVPLEKALRATERLVPLRLKATLERVAARVREGGSLGAALAAESGVFSPVTVGLVRAGERGAGLASALAQAATYLERQADTEARVRGALAYPLVLAVVGTVSIGFITLLVVPRFVALLGDVGQALPPATRVLLATSTLLRKWGVVLASVLAATGAVGVKLISEHRSASHEWLLRLPVIGTLRHALATARVARTLGALLGTGTPTLAALAIARESAGDDAIRARLEATRGRVAQGASLSTALEATAAVTAIAVQLAGIGEGSGRLPTLLAKAADLEEQAAERRLRTLVGFLEPALIIGFAALVAFVAAALLQAVYSVRPGGF
jgi:type II secretory pathway component PulF